ncbi:NUDIX domain-containing protein [bacterium]|nr:NUDIX domain-containing protein [bacterium]
MKKIIIASGPVIVKEGKVLLNISSKDKFWKFCGGIVKESETLKEATLRRAKEELGIDIKIIEERPFIMYTLKPNDERIDVILVHWFAAYSGEIVKGKDVEKWEWFDIDNLPDNLGPNIVPALKHFGFM